MHFVSIAFTDCHDAYKKGHRKTGIYRIQIPGMNDSDVRCDMTEEGGWIVFQRRLDANVDFSRNMTEYKNGFGQLNGSYWLGLDNIHQLAAPDRGAILRVDLKHINYPGKILVATYRRFIIYGEDRSYQLFVDGFKGNVSDGLTRNNWENFTIDDCSSLGKLVYPFTCPRCGEGGWWYYGTGGKCGTNLNARYHTGSSIDFFHYWSWFGITKEFGELSFSEMKLKYDT